MSKGEDGQRRAYDLEERLIALAIRVMEVAEVLPRTRVGNHVAGQLVRCGSSPPANYAEAQSAESRNDFIHKMKVCLKELRETRVWLRMIERKPLIKSPQRLAPLVQERSELIAIFTTSIGTAQKNRARAPM